MKIYIVRHGEVPHNALKQYNNEDEDLNEKGISQAEALKDKIKDIDYDIIISSPLIRARQLIVAHSGVSKAFSGYFEGIKDGMFLNRGLKNCEIKEYEM